MRCAQLKRAKYGMSLCLSKSLERIEYYCKTEGEWWNQIPFGASLGSGDVGTVIDDAAITAVASDFGVRSQRERGTV